MAKVDIITALLYHYRIIMGILCNKAAITYQKALRALVRLLVAVMIAVSLFTIYDMTAYADGGSLLDKIEYPIYRVRTGSNLRETPSVEGKWLMNVPKGAYVVLMDGKKHGNYYHVRYGAYDGYLYYGSITLAQDAVFSDYRLQFPELYGNESVAEAVDKEMADKMKELQEVYSDINNPDYQKLEDIDTNVKKASVIQMYTRENALQAMPQINSLSSGINIQTIKERDGARIEKIYQESQEIHGVAINRSKIRNVPSIEGEQIATINTDDEVIILDSGENGYIHIMYGNTEGFIYSRCIAYDTSLLDDAGLSIIDTVIIEEFEIAEEESKNYEQLLEEAKTKKREEELHEASSAISQEITTIATIEPQVIETSVSVKADETETPEEEKGPDTTKLTRRTNLRTLPDGNSNNITTLPAGTDVIVIGEAQGGYKMVQYNGMTGYILDNTTVNKVDVSKLGGEAVLFTCTAYCSCKKCCGSYSPEVRGGVAHTATGTVPQEGRTIAVDPSVIPYGTKVAIDGMGMYVAEDCGGAIKGNHIDIYFDTHEGALQFGTKRLYVTIVK